jgi:hypothetical protein
MVLVGAEVAGLDGGMALWAILVCRSWRGFGVSFFSAFFPPLRRRFYRLRIGRFRRWF